MNPKALHVLEFHKILQRLAAHTSFSAGRELALGTAPTDDLSLARQWLAETSEARRLLGEHSDVHLGGVHDVRPMLPLAERGAVLLAATCWHPQHAAAPRLALLTRQETRFPTCRHRLSHQPVAQADRSPGNQRTRRDPDNASLSGPPGGSRWCKAA